VATFFSPEAAGLGAQVGLVLNHLSLPQLAIQRFAFRHKPFSSH
jgi:hypothetical protein